MSGEGDLIREALKRAPQYLQTIAEGGGLVTQGYIVSALAALDALERELDEAYALIDSLPNPLGEVGAAAGRYARWTLDVFGPEYQREPVTAESIRAALARVQPAEEPGVAASGESAP